MQNLRKKNMEEGVFTALVPPIGEPVVVSHSLGASAVRSAAARGATEARLEYFATRQAGRYVVDLAHTISPPAARGRGLAAALVLAALRWAHGAGAAAILPSCTYVSQTFLPKYAAAKSHGVVPVEELRLKPVESGQWEFVAVDEAVPPPVR